MAHAVVRDKGSLDKEVGSGLWFRVVTFIVGMFARGFRAKGVAGYVGNIFVEVFRGAGYRTCGP